MSRTVFTADAGDTSVTFEDGHNLEKVGKGEDFDFKYELSKVIMAESLRQHTGGTRYNTGSLLVSSWVQTSTRSTNIAGQSCARCIDCKQAEDVPDTQSTRTARTLRRCEDVACPRICRPSIILAIRRVWPLNMYVPLLYNMVLSGAVRTTDEADRSRPEIERGEANNSSTRVHNQHYSSSSGLGGMH